MMFLQEVLALVTFYVSRLNRDIFKQYFLYNYGPLVRNSLPGALKVLSCQYAFKKNYKSYVLKWKSIDIY